MGESDRDVDNSMEEVADVRQTVIKGMLYYNIVSMCRVCFPAC